MDTQSINECERCGKVARGFSLHDYCANCGKNLCADCITKGCCGKLPAESGMAADYEDEAEHQERKQL